MVEKTFLMKLKNLVKNLLRKYTKWAEKRKWQAP